MWYLSGILIFFVYGLIFFLKDKTTPNNHLVSWVVLIIAAVTWPLSAPLAIIELTNKAKNKPDNSKAKIPNTKKITKSLNSN